jgi:hypothetical protein
MLGTIVDGVGTVMLVLYNELILFVMKTKFKW